MKEALDKKRAWEVRAILIVTLLFLITSIGFQNCSSAGRMTASSSTSPTASVTPAH